MPNITHYFLAGNHGHGLRHNDINMSPFLSLSNIENFSLLYLIERNMGRFLWIYQVQFLLFLLLLSQVTCSPSLPSLSMPICHQEQSSALLQFKNSFSLPHDNSISFHRDLYHGIQSYAKTNSWINGTYCCTWNGITCDNKTGHVIGIDISCSQLQGTVHSNSGLFSLQHL